MKAHLFIDGRRIGEVPYELPVENGKTIPIPTTSDEYDSEACVLISDGDGRMWLGRAKLRRDGEGPRITERDRLVHEALAAAKAIVGSEPITVMTRAPTVAQLQALQEALRKALSAPR